MNATIILPKIDFGDKKIPLAECQRRRRSDVGAVIDGSVCVRPEPEQDE